MQNCLHVYKSVYMPSNQDVYNFVCKVYRNVYKKRHVYKVFTGLHFCFFLPGAIAKSSNLLYALSKQLSQQKYIAKKSTKFEKG